LSRKKEIFGLYEASSKSSLYSISLNPASLSCLDSFCRCPLFQQSRFGRISNFLDVNSVPNVSLFLLCSKTALSPDQCPFFRVAGLLLLSPPSGTLPTPRCPPPLLLFPRGGGKDLPFFAGQYIDSPRLFSFRQRCIFSFPPPFKIHLLANHPLRLFLPPLEVFPSGYANFFSPRNLILNILPY